MARIEHDGVVYICADGTGGTQSVSDVLQNFGTMHSIIDPPPGGDVGGQAVLAGIYGHGYEFEININQGRLNFIRNGCLASQPLPRGSGKTLHLFARWEPESIDVAILEDGWVNLLEGERSSFESCMSATKTPFTQVPPQLIEWARKLSRLPAIPCKTPDDFYALLVNTLQQLQAKIEDAGAQRCFWDFGGAGAKPIPKAEPQVTATLHLLLQDVAAVNDFHIVPQAGAAGGSLDLLVSKVLEDRRLIKSAIEAKNAHSQQLEHGLIEQLPTYMRALAADFGIYLVLWYKCENYERPNDPDFFALRDRLMKTNPPLHIRIMHLDLSIPLPPSKR